MRLYAVRDKTDKTAFGLLFASGVTELFDNIRHWDGTGIDYEFIEIKRSAEILFNTDWRMGMGEGALMDYFDSHESHQDRGPYDPEKAQQEGAEMSAAEATHFRRVFDGVNILDTHGGPGDDSPGVRLQDVMAGNSVEGWQQFPKRFEARQRRLDRESEKYFAAARAASETAEEPPRNVIDLRRARLARKRGQENGGGDPPAA